jgi:predicted metalloprotease
MFNERARLDPSQVEDHRGRRFGTGSRGFGTGARAGGVGGIGLIILLVAAMVLGINPLDMVGTGPVTDTFTGLQDRTIGGPAALDSDLAEACQTGADANRREDCRIVGFVNSIQQYWEDAFRQRNWDYGMAKTRFFSGGTQTACGSASSEVGPFYCPLDQQVYIDLEFFNELLSRFGASGGPLAQGYVIAHEYGHHVQNQLGILDQIGRDQGPQSTAVRSELQADCLAGVWAGNAVETGFIRQLTDQDIADALSAAAAVGDDRIQRQTQGRVNPESWTHGSSEQRQRWFTVGYRTGEIENCDTFSGGI